MTIRLLLVIILGLLACGPASGQGSRVITVPESSDNAVKSAHNFHLKGVLISKSSRLALVNGKSVQAGDRVAGVEIIAINEAGVRVFVGAQELNVNIGGTIAGDPSANYIARKSRPASLRQHVVKSGETLSDIALRYRSDDVTTDQMMAALFDTNTQAFNDNINLMFAGVTLRIPDSNELHQRTPGLATAEVARHMNSWQDASTLQTAKYVAQDVIDKQDVEVKNGDTLSVIAVSVLHDGVTLDQMMIALYQKNQHAFDENINVLFAGATLQVPDSDLQIDYTPETATAEVVRQTRAWQSGLEQPEILSVAHSNLIAANKEISN